MGGVVRQKNKLYAIRVLTDFGYLNPNKLIKICEIAKKYTKSDISFTSRGNIEIIGLEKEKIGAIIEELEKEKIEIGGTGKTLRGIQTCKGRECKSGLINPNEIANLIQENLELKEFENKFKIGVFGCPNSSGKARSNDIGVIPFVDNNIVKFKLYFGGRMGREAIVGQELNKVIEKNEIVSVIKKTIEFYKEFGIKGERFSNTLFRIGFDKFQNIF
ncbi:hypothetical protein [Cetobacterium sp. SF1]|uniref:hypothetical protein n=1 Tax=unclassified Cetobacterium TaxID=2630983 RepID=UPI003CF4F985